MLSYSTFRLANARHCATLPATRGVERPEALTGREGWEAMGASGYPEPQGLYDPRYEHDSCGVGFVVDIKGRTSHALVCQALAVLKNLLHRGACGSEPNTGDGAGIL